MSEERLGSESNGPAKKQTAAGFGLVRWFAAGFVLTFVAFLLLMSQFVFSADGKLIRCKLWQYYWLELNKAFSGSTGLDSNPIGPSVWIVLLQHLAISLVCGVFLVILVSVFRRIRRRKLAGDRHSE